MQIYLARHGTTGWNRLHKIQGQTDIPLDDEGILMSSFSGEALKALGITFDHVFSSPLSRAYETAKLLSSGAAIISDNRLIELSFGDFEGQVTNIISADPSLPFYNFRHDPARYNDLTPDYKAESLTHLMNRTEDFMKECVEPLVYTASNILISGHGALNRGLLMYIRGTDDLNEFWGAGLQTNCGITIISCDADAQGKVSYTILENCKTFYDQALINDPGKLL